MNQSIDLYLRSMRGYIMELAAALDIGSGTAFRSIQADLEKTVIEKSFVRLCPFCMGTTSLDGYDNAVGVKCDDCGASSALVSSGCDSILTDLEKFLVCVDERFAEGGKWYIDGTSPLPPAAINIFRVSAYVIAAWYALEKWNRRPEQ